MTSKLTIREWVGVAGRHYGLLKYDDDLEDPPWMNHGWYESGAQRAHLEELETGRTITPIGGALLNLWDYLTWPFSIAICEWLGHRLVDESYGGPESGYMGTRCTRCGESRGQTLY